MKIKQGYILKHVANQHIVVPVGEEAINFNGLLNLNESGVLLFEKLQEGTTLEALLKLLKETYEVDDKRALEDIESFINILKSKNLFE